MERFFKSFKGEWMPALGYRDYDEAEQDIAAYMLYYNHNRSHSYSNNLPPAVAERAS